MLMKMIMLALLATSMGKPQLTNYENIPDCVDIIGNPTALAELSEEELDNLFQQCCVDKEQLLITLAESNPSPEYDECGNLIAPYYPQRVYQYCCENDPDPRSEFGYCDYSPMVSCEPEIDDW